MQGHNYESGERMKKIICLGGLFFIIAGLYIARVEIMQKIIPVVAAGYGLQINALEISQIGLNKAVVRHILLAHEAEHARVSVAANDIALDLDLSINAEQRITAIKIDHAAVDIRVSRAERAAAPAAAATMALRDYMQRLPLYGIDIRRLQARYYAGAELLAEYTGRVEYAKGIYLAGSLNYRGHAGNIDFSLDGEAIKASLGNADDEFIRLQGDYHIDNERLRFKLESAYELRAISRFMAQENNLSVQRVEGRIETVAELNLAHGLDQLAAEFATDMAFDASIHFSSRDYAIEKARLDVRAQCMLTPQGIKNCRIDKPQRLALQLAATPSFISEYFNKPPRSYTIDLQPDKVITLQPPRDANNAWTVTGDSRLSVYPDAAQFEIAAEFSGLDFRFAENGWSLSSDYHIQADAAAGTQPLKRRRAKFHARGNLLVNPDQAGISIDDGAGLALSDVAYAEIFLDTLTLRQNGRARAVYNFRDNALKIEDQRLSLIAKGAGYTDITFDLQTAALNFAQYGFAENKPFIQAELSIAGMSALKNGLQINGSECLTAIHLDNDNLKINGALRLGTTPLRFLASNDLSTGGGLLQFESSSMPLANNEMVTQMISGAGFPLQIKDGAFSLSGKLNWTDYQAARMAITLSAEQVSGDYAQNPFVNLNVAMSLEKDDGWILAAPASLAIDQLNVGLPLKDIALRIEHYRHGVAARPVIKLADFRAGVLEGSVFSDTIEIDLNKPVNQFSLYLSALSLEKLLELNRTEALQATGIINGELPLSLSEGALKIDDGWLAADERGGVIRYNHIEKLLSGNDDLKLVAGLLENFRYNEMSARVNLNPAGALTLQTKLYGRGPEAEFDAPVNLNFNIDLDLWKFLESARLLARIGQDISRQVGAPLE